MEVILRSDGRRDPAAHSANQAMHRSGGGERLIEIKVNSRHPVMAVVRLPRQLINARVSWSRPQLGFSEHRLVITRGFSLQLG